MEIVLITALWCTSCLIMRPRYQQLFNNKVVVNEFDYDQDSHLITKYNVGNLLPVLIVYQNGKEIKRIVGEKSIKELNTFLGGIIDV